MGGVETHTHTYCHTARIFSLLLTVHCSSTLFTVCNHEIKTILTSIPHPASILFSFFFLTSTFPVPKLPILLLLSQNTFTNDISCLDAVFSQLPLHPTFYCSDPTSTHVLSSVPSLTGCCSVGSGHTTSFLLICTNHTHAR